MSDYNQHSITITLNFDTMNLPADLDMDIVAKMLTNDEWSDGRYPFYTEMLHVGLGHMLKRAIGDAVAKVMEKKYGRETVQDGSTTWSRAHLKTEEAMKGVSAHILDSIKEAKIGKPVKE
jgi:hypothetical protein